MSKSTQTVLAGLLLLCAVSILGGMFYLVFIFPKTAESWVRMGRELTSCQVMTAYLCNFCQVFGIVLFPVVLLMTLGSGMWMAISFSGAKKASVNHRIHSIQNCTPF
jgi:type II secretory pathway component PulF